MKSTLYYGDWITEGNMLYFEEKIREEPYDATDIKQRMEPL